MRENFIRYTSPCSGIRDTQDYLIGSETSEVQSKSRDCEVRCPPCNGTSQSHDFNDIMGHRLTFETK